MFDSNKYLYLYCFPKGAAHGQTLGCKKNDQKNIEKLEKKKMYFP